MSTILIATEADVPVCPGGVNNDSVARTQVVGPIIVCANDVRTASWLIPASGYVAVVGVLGILTKLALRHVSWTDMVVSTALVYGCAAGALVLSGSGDFRLGRGGAIALAAGVCAAGGLTLSFIALRHADASRAVPFMSAYPVVTVVLAVLLLSESVSLSQGVGIALVLAGVVLLGR
jgi:transporter family protein